MDRDRLRQEIISHLEPDDLVDILGLNIEELTELLSLQIEAGEEKFYFLDREMENEDEE